MESVKRFTQAYYQAPWRKQLQLIVGFMVALIVVAVIAGIYLNISARAVSEGHQIQVMQGNIDKIQLEISGLETTLANLSSTQVMESRARELGYRPVDADNLSYIEVPGYSGRQTAVLAQPPKPVVVAVQTVPPVFTESLVDWFQKNVFGPNGVLAEVRP
jgi:cell division protein FtsL